MISEKWCVSGTERGQMSLRGVTLRVCSHRQQKSKLYSSLQVFSYHVLRQTVVLLHIFAVLKRTIFLIGLWVIDLWRFVMWEMLQLLFGWFFSFSSFLHCTHVNTTILLQTKWIFVVLLCIIWLSYKMAICCFAVYYMVIRWQKTVTV